MLDILSQIKPKIARVVGEDSYKTWIEPLKFLGYKDNTCSIVVPNAFFRDWVAENFESVFVSLLKDVTGESVRIDYVLKKEDAVLIPPEEKRGIFLRKASTYNQFNPKYTFESFVVGSSNQFANAACLAVATNPGKTYNPLLIYSGVGLGKTHLLNAVGNFLISSRQC